MQTQRWRGRRQGQILVLFAVGLVTIILAVGLVVDVGFAFAEQRSIQNGADAAARSGAIVLAQRAAEGPSSTITATDVWDAVVASADANEVSIEEAVYTDWQGNILPGSPSVSSVANPIPTDA